MEPSNNCDAIATEGIASSQSMISQEDWENEPCEEVSDCKNKDSEKEAIPPVMGRAARVKLGESWPNVAQSGLSLEEALQVVCAETPSDPVREDEAVYCPHACTNQPWPGEGDIERDRRWGFEVEMCTSGISQPSQQQPLIEQEDLPIHGNTSDHQQGEPLLHRLSLLEQNQEAQQVFERSPPLATVAQEPASQAQGCHGSACVVCVKERAGTRGEREEEVIGQTGGKGEQSTVGLHTGEEGREGQTERAEESKQSGETRVKVGAESESNHQVHLRGSGMDFSNVDDNQSDSGVSADFSPSSTLELCSFPPEDPRPSPLNETPIEREIRRTMEREQSLRRARGLTKTQEFVEVPLMKPVLSRTLPSRSGKAEGLDRQFAGKKMQREISLEAQREEVLVQLGKVPGSYDKGTVRQLRERKQLFEAFQEPKETLDSPRTQSTRRSSSVASDISALGSQKDHQPSSGPTLELINQKQHPKLDKASCREEDSRNNHQGLCGPMLTEGTSSQVIILESNMIFCPRVPNQNGVPNPRSGSSLVGHPHKAMVGDLGARTETGRVIGELGGREEGRDLEMEGEEEEDETSMVKENPFFKLRSSMSLRPDVEQDIQQGRQRERELRKQRNNLYGTPGTGGGRTASPAASTATPSQNGLTAPVVTSHESSSTLPGSARQSLGKLGLTWPPTQSSVKGQTEVARSRKKTALFERWESGMVNGHQEEQD
ncbi:hypothetical protein GJAV_G00144280 [Gymnothorax javanicus]|nr:hypothetical protein GJAV_G00144280 [Gymnothorax javanicus]